MARHGKRCGMVLVVVFSLLSLFILLLHISSLTSIHLQHTTFNTASRTFSRSRTKTSNGRRNCSYPLSYYDRWYKPLDSYKKVHLVFYKKNRMEVAAEIALSRGWMLHPRTLMSLADLEAIVSNEESSFIVIFTSSRELSSPAMTPYLSNPRVLLTGIPYAYQFTGAKREQYLIFNEYLSRHGCSIARLRLMPSSYLMDSARQCRDFFDRIADRTRERNGDPGLWLQKTSRGFGGSGVSIIKNFTMFRQKYGSCKSANELIVQEYISDLLLLGGHKFDIRVFVLISGTAPYMMFYHEGYLRVAIQPFDINGPVEVHLTNTHVQSSQKDYHPDSHFWSFDKFQSYLDYHHKDNDNFVSRRLVPYTEALGVFILNSGMCTF